MSQFITITKENQGQRLDKFLNEKLADKTRSQIKKMIKAGLVLIDNKPAKVHQFLKAGNKIEMMNDEQKISSLPSPSFNQEGEAGGGGHLLPKIIYENNDYLILEKPAGLLVHPTEKGETDTLVDWLVKKYPKTAEVGEQNYRAGIIHRLDKDVSGVMVAAKNSQAFHHLKEQFKKRLVKKEYLALVYGRVQKEAGEINLPIGRNKIGQFVAHPRQGKLKFQDQDKFAKTRYQVLEYLKDYTLLQVEILTGRTHQIRAHLQAIGHPILGDQIYKPKKPFFHWLRRKIKVVNPGRIFLHSTKIGFYDLNNQWREFESPLPKKLTDFTNALKK